MSLEVEMKAWVVNPDVIQPILEKRFIFKKQIHREDVYFQREGMPFDADGSVRLRKDGKHWVVTFKKKTLHEGMEMNNEHEFRIYDTSMFHLFMKHIRMEPRIDKIKDCLIFEGPEEGLTIELNHVHNLGWFLEIEWLLENDGERTPAQMKDRLLSLYDSLGIPADKLEPRYYTDMLMNGE